MLDETQDTIVAQATPPGRAALGMVRVSGGACEEILRKMFEPRRGGPLVPFRPLVGRIVFEGGIPLDEAVTTFYSKPHSYTREDLAEITCHGNPVIVEKVLERIVSCGARLARPGEFTYRAFLNGRLDLVQAEAVQDLISADSLYQAELALQHLGGRLSGKLQELRSRMIDVVALLEGNIDFSEEQHYHFIDKYLAADKVGEICVIVSNLLGTFERGRLIRDGFAVALVGRPNVGKSSLFNALLGHNRAIVTPVPGTTRDYLRERITLGNFLVHLIDTAGIRESQEVVEKEGIERSRQMVEQSDLVVFILDGAADCADEDLALWELVKRRDCIVVFNKADLPAFHPAFAFVPAGLAVSATGGNGVEGLVEEIRRRVEEKVRFAESDSLISSLRHRDILKTSLNALMRAKESLEAGVSEEFSVTDLHLALTAVGEITGEVTVDDIYQEIFSRFCIGK